jgi:two-component system chemotaxis response regulator CheB
MTPRIRVLITDDSSTQRQLQRTLLGEHPELEIVGEAHDGEQAVALCSTLRPAVVTMDVLMPRLDGLGATARIMRESPARILIVASVEEGRQVDLSFQAMAAGALMVMAKARTTDGASLRRWADALARNIVLMSEIPVVTRRPRLVRPPSRAVAVAPVGALGIAASTGGPPALVKILSALPGNLAVPVLVAQHLAPGFTGGLVRWLKESTPLQVAIATPGIAARPGTVYLPPDHCDLIVDAEGLLSTPTSPGGHCPSADRLLTSLARAYRARALGMVLTGMGEDGAQGLLAIRRAGGPTLVQDEASSVVFGMPQAALKLGAAEAGIPLSDLAGEVMRLCRPRGT